MICPPSPDSDGPRPGDTARFTTSKSKLSFHVGCWALCHRTAVRRACRPTGPSTMTSTYGLAARHRSAGGFVHKNACNTTEIAFLLQFFRHMVDMSSRRISGVLENIGSRKVKKKKMHCKTLFWIINF